MFRMVTFCYCISFRIVHIYSRHPAERLKTMSWAPSAISSCCFCFCGYSERKQTVLLKLEWDNFGKAPLSLFCHSITYMYRIIHLCTLYLNLDPALIVSLYIDCTHTSTHTRAHKHKNTHPHTFKHPFK